jgi:hypothetical protein
MAITVKHTKVSTIPDGDDSSLIRPSDWNDDHALTGLGTMAEQDANSVAITGGSISGVTVSGYIPTSEKGANNGVATLDANGKVPTSQIPMQGDLNYQGTWNATTNTPTLTSSVGIKGYYYVVDVAGTTNLNGITDWQIGDWAIFNGSVWQKVDNTDAVTSVNGQVGTVVLTTTDIAEGTNLYYTDVRARASNSAGTGISYDSATGVITNSAPDQTVALTDGTAIDVTGTYPNFTINNTAPDQIVALTGAGTTSISGTYPNFTITSNDSTLGTVTSVAATAGTGISVTGSPITTSGTLNITNTAPDQTVVLTAGTGISTSGTYPNFTITNTSPSLGGDVVGPASATDNAVARFDTTTGKLIQNSLVIIGDTGSVTGVNALTAESLTVNNNATFGTSNSDTINFVGRVNSDFDPATDNTYDLGRVGHEWRDLYIDGTANIDSLIADTADINAGTIDNTTIGATTPQNGSFVNLSVTGTTSFDGSQGTSGQVLTSAGTGNTPTWTTPTVGTVTSITAGTGLTGGTITTSGTIAIDSTVVTTAGSYANPSWITSLDGSKITGTIDGGTF